MNRLDEIRNRLLGEVEPDEDGVTGFADAIAGDEDVQWLISEVERLSDVLGAAEAERDEARAELDTLRAAVAAIADEWASSRGPLGWTVNDAVQHQCADELRTLLGDPDDSSNSHEEKD